MWQVSTFCKGSKDNVWKDVNYFFGVLQARFQVIANPSCQWNREVVVVILMACVTLHNMIIVNEYGDNLELAFDTIILY
jgi:3-hydroxymyristoyl/3-hydroxydecanoyl-(acyl carrier protein) dehydratase